MESINRGWGTGLSLFRPCRRLMLAAFLRGIAVGTSIPAGHGADATATSVMPAFMRENVPMTAVGTAALGPYEFGKSQNPASKIVRLWLIMETADLPNAGTRDELTLNVAGKGQFPFKNTEVRPGAPAGLHAIKPGSPAANAPGTEPDDDAFGTAPPPPCVQPGHAAVARWLPDNLTLADLDEGKVSVEIHGPDGWLPTQFHLIGVLEGNLARVLYSLAWPAGNWFSTNAKAAPAGATAQAEYKLSRAGMVPEQAAQSGEVISDIWLITQTATGKDSSTKGALTHVVPGKLENLLAGRNQEFGYGSTSLFHFKDLAVKSITWEALAPGKVYLETKSDDLWRPSMILEIARSNRNMYRVVALTVWKPKDVFSTDPKDAPYAGLASARWTLDENQR